MLWENIINRGEHLKALYIAIKLSEWVPHQGKQGAAPALCPGSRFTPVDQMYQGLPQLRCLQR